MMKLIPTLVFSLALFQACSLFTSSASDSISGSSGSISGSAKDGSSEIVSSLSKSISSISRSISDSSSGGDEKPNSLYREDAKTLFLAYSRTKEGNWEKDLGFVARDHGVFSWKTSKDTYVALGAALRTLGTSKEEMDSYSKKFGPYKDFLWQGYLNP